MIELKIVSSLEKCFIDESIDSKKEYKSATALRGDRISFQVCFSADKDTQWPVGLKARVESSLGDRVRLSRVMNVPANMPVYPGKGDDNYLRKTAGLYPDLLIPEEECREITAVAGQLHALWVEVDVPEDTLPSEYPLWVVLETLSGEEMARDVFTLRVLDAVPAPQSLIFTQWFHCDCLASYYKVKVFSEEHWRIIRSFIRTAVRNGMNMILTPVITPALDTAIGGERLTAQLVGITVTYGEYSFEFSGLSRWIDTCIEEGIEYFEIAHLYTQWGAAHAPKIVATVDGVEKRIFGWETDGGGEEYTAFLNTFIPALRAFLRERGVEDRCYFHISDEPGGTALETYKKAKAAISRSIEGLKMMDALSDYEFYTSGAVPTPVVAVDHIQPFIDGGVEELWAYYCCGQYTDVSNRFLAMPSARNRIIGVQMFYYGIKGFLHWGYNFYSSQFSHYPVDPYRTTDGDSFVPSGDPFSVYPAPDGRAYESIRLNVFADAIRDIRALEALSEKIGREAVLKLIDEMAGEKITFKSYPHDDGFILDLRERVNGLLAK